MPNSSSKVLVIGGTGHVSRQVIEGLLAAGHEVVATTRAPETQPAAPGLRWVGLDVQDPASIDAAFAGVERAFLLSPAGIADQYSFLAPLIEASARHQLKKVVLMTALGVEFAPAEVPMRRAELALEATGLPHAILRPNWFMQNFNTFWVGGIQAHDAIQLPAGDARSAFIDVRDIGAVAAALVQRDGTDGGLTITGPEALSHDEVAAKLSALTQRTIRYEHSEPETFRQGLLAGGVPGDYAQLLVDLYASVRQGHAATVSDGVRQVLGREPIGFERYAADHQAAFAPLAAARA